jgi:hypothetical protein
MRHRRGTPGDPTLHGQNTIPPGPAATPPAATRIIGAAGFTDLAASWPLAVLTISPFGVSVDLRFHLLKRLVGQFTDREPSSVWWIARWTDLEPVDSAGRSVILRATGQEGCRFQTLTHRQLRPLMEELEQRNILVTPVTTTLRWFLKRT